MAAPASEDALPPHENGSASAEFEAFDRFPWSKHRAFLLGLVETLGGVDSLSPSPTHEGSATFCRTVFYRRQTGRRVDLTRYNSFLVSSPAYPSVDRRLLAALYAAKKAAGDVSGSGPGPGPAANHAATPANDSPLAPSSSQSPSRRIVDAVAAGPLIDPFDGTATPPLDGISEAANDDVPSWQRSAPKNELRVPRAAATAADEAAAAAAATDGAPYSDKFAKVIEAVQTGKELEGIRHIPDTVVRQAGITPLGKLKAPKKPWELAAAASNTSPPPILSYDGLVGEESAHLSLVDMQFPPPPEPTPDRAANGVANQ